MRVFVATSLLLWALQAPAPPLTVHHLACGQSRWAAVTATGDVLTWGKLGELQAAWTDEPVSIPGLSDVTQMAVGPGVTLALTGEGRVFAWGTDTDLLGGAAPRTDGVAPVPVPIASLSDVVQVAAGTAVAYAVRRDGTVWAWGNVRTIASGLAAGGGTTTRPVQVPVLSNVTTVASGFNHGLALTSLGEVFAWGNNAQGELGDGTTELRDGPVKVSGLSNVVAIASSASGKLAILADGTVRVWGSNATGNLANGTRDGFSAVPVPVKGIANAVAADGGTAHFAVLLNDGTIRLWGQNAWGETTAGRPGAYTLAPVAPKLPGPVARVEAGGYNTYVTLTDGRVLGIGLIYATPWGKYRTHTVQWQTLGPTGFTRPTAGG